MGVDSSKKEILKIIQEAKFDVINLKNEIHPKREHNDDIDYFEEENYTSSNNEKENEENSDDFFNFDEVPELNNPKLDVKNIMTYPYNSIGTISVQYPLSDELFEYTCFLIDSNVVVTLASNLENKNKGGKAKLITTSFSKENVKWENIFIQGDDKESKDNGKYKNPKESSDNLSSKLAIIKYDNINKEWLGVESGKKEDFEGRYICAVFSLQQEKNNIIISIDEKEKGCPPKLREISVENGNPFLVASQKGEKEDIELAKRSPGSPIYYLDYNYEAHVIAIINEFFEIQYFDKIRINFLINIINKLRQNRIKMEKDFSTECIVKLNLEKHNLGTSDIKYLTTFDFTKLRILDLNNNSINAKGALFLSQAKFNSLELLNLSYNKLGDEGVTNISNGFFSKLNSLYLTRNYITSEGIKSLLKSEFINYLIVLSLSDNRKIGDIGVRYMKEHKGWGRLSILNLDFTGLTDISLSYLGEASMPQLKELNIIDNKFTENGQPSINALGMNHIKVRYKIGKDEKVKTTHYQKAIYYDDIFPYKVFNDYNDDLFIPAD